MPVTCLHGNLSTLLMKFTCTVLYTCTCIRREELGCFFNTGQGVCHHRNWQVHGRIHWGLSVWNHCFFVWDFRNKYVLELWNGENYQALFPAWVVLISIAFENVAPWISNALPRLNWLASLCIITMWHYSHMVRFRHGVYFCGREAAKKCDWIILSW